MCGMSAADELAEVEALRSQLRTFMADTSFTEEYQLPNGVRVRRAALKGLLSYYDSRADVLNARVSKASRGRVRVGSLGSVGGIYR